MTTSDPHDQPRNRAERRDVRFGRVSAVQSALALSSSAAYALVASGEIASIKVGKSIRVDLDDLERYVAENRRGGRSLADVAEA
jgi:excisionase family DNA binding protein